MEAIEFQTVSEDIKNIFVSILDYWNIVGNEVYRVRILTSLQLKIGQKVRVCVDNYKGLDHYPAALIRFITGISSAIPLYSDDTSMVVVLNVFNESSL